MYSALLLTTVLSAAQLATAQVIEFALAPTATRPKGLDARAPDYQCASSVFTDLITGPTPDSEEFLDWIMSVTDAAACTVTAPASLSDEYTSWFNEVTDWADDIDERARKQTNCDFDTLTLSFSGFCQEAKRTVLFTDESGDKTSTLTQDKLPLPTGVRIGAAPHNNAVVGAGMALAGFVAAAVAL